MWHGAKNLTKKKLNIQTTSKKAKPLLEENGNWTRKQTLPLRFSGVCRKLKKSAKGQNDLVAKDIHNMSFDDFDDLDDFKL